MAKKNQNVKNLLKLLGILPAIRRGLRRGNTATLVRQHLLPAMDLHYRGAMKRRFLSGNVDRGVGGAWAPLSPGYAAYKRSVVGDLPILVFSGPLSRSFTQPGAQHLSWIRKGVAFFGSSHWKAERHEFGMDSVPRILSGGSPETMNEMEKDVEKYVRTVMVKKIADELRGLNARPGKRPATAGGGRMPTKLGEN